MNVGFVGCTSTRCDCPGGWGGNGSGKGNLAAVTSVCGRGEGMGGGYKRRGGRFWFLGSLLCRHQQLASDSDILLGFGFVSLALKATTLRNFTTSSRLFFDHQLPSSCASATSSGPSSPLLRPSLLLKVRRPFVLLGVHH